MKSRVSILGRIRKGKTFKVVSAFLAINLIFQIISPSMALALTAGPSSPEFSSFEPVATTDMVNDFSGDFTYNLPVLSVPGPDGGGYSMSLSYHSGVSSEEEASWVGFGWTLNPGAINRQKRGYPDDFKNKGIKTYNKVKPNVTSASEFNFNIELVSKDEQKSKDKEEGDRKKNKKSKDKETRRNGNKAISEATDKVDDPADVSVSFTHSTRYNNYSGFSIANGVGVGLFGAANMSMNNSGGENTFGVTVNPLAVLKKIGKEKHKKAIEKANKDCPEEMAAADKVGRLGDKIEKYTSLGTKQGSKIKAGISVPHSYSMRSYNGPALSASVAKNAGNVWKVSGSVQINPTIPFGFQFGLGGSVSVVAQEGESQKYAFGYMYSGGEGTRLNDGNDEFSVFDYQLEKESTFDKHDKYIGIPFNNADVFSMTGNGVSGGFKLMHDRIGHFYPNPVKNDTRINQIGVELGIGLTFEIGFDLGIGFQHTKVTGEWNKVNYPSGGKSHASFSANLPKMRFTNDMGGEVTYDNDYNKLLYSTISGGRKLDLSDYDLSLDPDKAQSSSYIDYSTTSDGLIKELTVVQKDGNVYEYHEPVYVYNEKELTVSLENYNDGKSVVYSESLDVNNPLNNKTVVGVSSYEPYASTYLLSATKTFDYVDADAITGPSEGDFGGWTLFKYRSTWGSYGYGGWYRYRSPYNGFNYNRGRVIDGDDQTGSVSMGYKSINYLKAIETKTHVAFFITNKTQSKDFTEYGVPSAYQYYLEGSKTARYDGLDAADINSDGTDAATASEKAQGTHYSEKLERIVLFSKSDFSKPISTTFFEYDYALCQGVHNNINNGNSPLSTSALDKGKLTLRKVWTESGGVTKSKIAPYQFYYEYFKDYSSDIITKYPWAQGFNDMKINANAITENPAYLPGQLDMWGFYQENGVQRNANMQYWVSQKAPSVSFDPAAWQLKRIQLPSGGEIHINYEQSDYCYVQNQEAMAMVSLDNSITKENNNTDDGYKASKTKYYINYTDLNISPDAPLNLLNEYVNKLSTYFVTKNNKIYYKFLYRFAGGGIPILNSKGDWVDYVSGYTSVNKVELTSDKKICLHLGDVVGLDDFANKEDRGNLYDGDKDKTLPRYNAYQNVLTNGAKSLGINSRDYTDQDDKYISQVYAASDISAGVAKVARGSAVPYVFDLFFDWTGGHVKNVKKKDACREFNPSLSYFKLPVYYAKKGGGIRVKRLLMYDPGLETGDAMIYGTEYSYKTTDGKSSGVTTNEPSSGREENALVGILERNKQTGFNRALNGRDSKTQEGPLGENVMPSASVGYSRIVINNIHSGKTTTGYSVNTYNTCKDYPFTFDNSDLSKQNSTYRKTNLTLPLGVFNMTIQRAWLSQGYIFYTNDMHGKIQSKSVYAGNYNPATFSEKGFTSQTLYNYSKPGSSINTLLYDPVADQMHKSVLKPGTEEDFTAYMSDVEEISCDFSIEIDLNITLPIEIYPSFSPSFNFSESKLCQHSTSKLVSQVSYLLSTTTTTDGVTQTTENLGFDKYTGDPVLTRTFDGFMAPSEKLFTERGTTAEATNGHSGYYYSLNIPASWVYKDMSPKSADPNNSNQLTASAGSVVTYGKNEMYDKISDPLGFVWKPHLSNSVNFPLTTVVNASSTVYKNNWFISDEFNDIPTGVRSQLNKHYYPIRTYVYRDDVKDANQNNVRIYNGGVMSANFDFFDWTKSASYYQDEIYGSQLGKWYSPSQAMVYSPFGYPIEEMDVLKISSTAKYGYENTLPILVAQNAKNNEVVFSDFELRNGFAVGVITSNDAHSGQYALDLKKTPNYVFATDYNISNDMLVKNGLGIRLWLKSDLQDINNENMKNDTPMLKAVIGGKTFDMKKIAETGNWALYIAEIKTFKGLSSGEYDVTLSYNFVPGEIVYVDDFRMQPLNSMMNCTVYTKDNKVAAQFDDQHFGVYYEYNQKGQLVRKSIETERGKKTLQEQQYNTPLTDKSN